MNEKINKILEETPHRELVEWLGSQVEADEKLALALIERFWTPDETDYKSAVEACLMHPSRTGASRYNWVAVTSDLSTLMARAQEMMKSGKKVEAAMIARYVVPIVCKAYASDYDGQEDRFQLQLLINDAVEIVDEVLVNGNEIGDDERREVLGEFVVECRTMAEVEDWLFPAVFLRKLLVDASRWIQPMKEYLARIDEQLKYESDESEIEHLVENKIKCMLINGKKDMAIDVMVKYIDNENIRAMFVGYLIEWGEYERAFSVISHRNVNEIYLNVDWIGLELKVLDLIGNRQRTIDFCREKFLTAHDKLIYYRRLKSMVGQNDWHDFILSLLDECDFDDCYDDADLVIYAEEGLHDRVIRFFNRALHIWEMSAFRKYGSLMSYDEQRDVIKRYGEQCVVYASGCSMKKQYKYLADVLKELSKLGELGAQEAALRVDELTKLYSRRTALIKELKKINL